MENKNILIIEDNELNMKLMRGVLSIGDYQLIEAFDAETGIRLARKQKPFLILMDIQLPGMDGLEATRIIKTDSKLKDIPVVAITGFAMQGDREKALESGCDDYITKPFDFEDLLKTIEGYYNRKETPNGEQRMVLK
jgi:CheY-like chemotaxis protein